MADPQQTQPSEPGAAPAPQPAQEPAPARRMTWRRLLLITGVVALVTTAVAGVGAYAAARSSQLARDTASCGASSRCIPGLPAAAVLEKLKAAGHECETTYGRWRCEFEVGGAFYTAYIYERRELINEIGLTVSGAGDELTASQRAYLTWFATVPFAHDPAFTAEIEAWLAQKLDAGENVTATVGQGYRYELAFHPPRRVDLKIEAGK